LKEHLNKLKIPKNFQDVKEIGKILSFYTKQYYLFVFIIYSTTYIFLQNFSIPSSIFLSLLGSHLYGFFTGTLLVCTLSTIGATNSYCISYFIGKKLIFSKIRNFWKTS
jgi:uncharacterized membrane protein YdjX (TVP38/TMEM64 family)